MALKLVQWDSSASKFKVGGTAPADFRAGMSNIGAGVTTLTVTFSSALPSTSYALTCTWYNTTDSFPQQQVPIITAFSTTGFTVTWAAPTDTSNYRISWIVMQNG